MDVVRKLNLSADSAAGAACVFTYDRQCLEPTLGWAQKVDACHAFMYMLLRHFAYIPFTPPMADI